MSTILAALQRTGASSRRRFSDHTPEVATIGLYIVMLASVIPFHQPGVDETQAWQLARSVPIPQLFVHNLRYEGAPGLWYLLIKLTSRLHVGYLGLHWLCGLIAVCAVSQ